MAKIERGQFSSLLRRYLGMTGVSDVLDELAPEISATFPLEYERPEWEWLKGAKLMGHRTQTGAQVGQPSSVRYRNPPNSGVIAIFTGLHVMFPGGTDAAILTWGATTSDLGTVSGTVPRDTRNTIFGSAIIASFESGGAGGLSFDQISLLTGTTGTFFIGDRANQFVLTPGNALNITSLGLNIVLHVGTSWLEKRLDALESV